MRAIRTTSARTRWWGRGMLPALVILAGVPLYVANGNWPAAVLAIAYLPLVYFLCSRARHLYRAGWYGGRVSMHLDVHDVDPEPWGDIPPRAAVTRVEFPAFVAPEPLHDDCDCEQCRLDDSRPSITCPDCGRTSIRPRSGGSR